MNEWKCPLDNIDSDIRELVKIALNSDMHPYMSCSGSYKDHKNSPAIPVYGFIEVLDSEHIREIIAILINNKNFTCKIKKAPEASFYGNKLPEGLRFEIDFENARGKVGQELRQLFNDVVLGRRSMPSDKKKVDSICKLLSEFSVKDGSQIGFSFNSPRIDTRTPSKDNYAIEISGRKDMQSLIDEINNNTDGIEQDENLCTIYGSEIATIGAVLKKVIMTYKRLPNLEKGRNNRQLILPTREDVFLKRYNSHIKEARADSDTIDISVKYLDISQFLDL